MKLVGTTEVQIRVKLHLCSPDNGSRSLLPACISLALVALMLTIIRKIPVMAKEISSGMHANIDDFKT